jgi:hypothetical protein
VLSRGERIELLVDKTDAMSSQARAFRKRSQALRRRMWWRNTKLIALTVLVVIVRVSLTSQSQRGVADFFQFAVDHLLVDRFFLRCELEALRVMISPDSVLNSPFSSFYLPFCPFYRLSVSVKYPTCTIVGKTRF